MQRASVRPLASCNRRACCQARHTRGGERVCGAPFRRRIGSSFHWTSGQHCYCSHLTARPHTARSTRFRGPCAPSRAARRPHATYPAQQEHARVTGAQHVAPPHQHSSGLPPGTQAAHDFGQQRGVVLFRCTVWGAAAGAGHGGRGAGTSLSPPHACHIIRVSPQRAIMMNSQHAVPWPRIPLPAQLSGRRATAASPPFSLFPLRSCAPFSLLP